MAMVIITQTYSSKFAFTDRHEQFLEKIEDIIGHTEEVVEYSVTRGTTHGHTDVFTHTAAFDIS